MVIFVVALDDWEPATDPTTGRQYYVNRITRESSWTEPNKACVATFLKAAGISRTVPAGHLPTHRQTQFVQGAKMVATQNVPIRKAQTKGSNHVAMLSNGDSFTISSIRVDDVGTQLKVKASTVNGKLKPVSGWIRPFDRHGNLLVRPTHDLASGRGTFEQEPERSTNRT